MVLSAAVAPSLSGGAPVCGAGSRLVDETFGAEHQPYTTERPCLATALRAMERAVWGLAARGAFFPSLLDAGLVGGAGWADLRYCVTLPSAYTLLCAAGQGEDLQRLALCEQEVAAGVKALLSVLPAEHLALQWDVPAELRVWQTRGRDLNAPRGLPERLLQSMVTQWAEVPEQAELGLHLCHVAGTGASGLSIPDIGQAVRLVGAIIASTERQPQFVHLPVPPERDGTAYFESLLNLALWPSMEVHLGLVHEQDSPEDVATRLSAAREVLPYAAASLACQTRPATGLRLLGVDHA